MKKVDLLIVNNCPSFYKINLYNELAKQCDILVIFLALTNQVVITDDYKKQIKFPFRVMNEIQIEKRCRLITFLRLILFCANVKFRRLIIGGYDNFETFLLPFIWSKKKNVLQCESNIMESVVSGCKGYIKRVLFSRYSIVLPSGKLHWEIFKALNYKGICKLTKGVGIIHKDALRNFVFERKSDFSSLKYIYVGRIITLKNIRNLIEVFNENRLSLTIVGDGPLALELQSIANNNICFRGFVANDKLGELYMQHDVFILPSFQEPWGLVVEEAINWGLPVIVSDAVGSQTEMVLEPQTGIVFCLSDSMGLSKAIAAMEENYEFYKSNVMSFDFDQKDREQLNAYLSLL